MSKPVILRISDQANEPQRFNGYITGYTLGELATDDMREYQIRMVSWFEFLKLHQDCRVYRNQTVPQIVTTIFKRYWFAEYELALNRRYEPRVYCVQYNETDYDFINRILEESGIYYSFVHEGNKQTLVLNDFVPTMEPFHSDTMLAYQPTEQPHFYTWSRHHQSTTTQVSGQHPKRAQPTPALYL